ncbi:MAG: DUF86 domain-containing protein [Acidobacteriota bacterium]
MRIDSKRIESYLYDIKKNSIELENLLKEYSGEEILQNSIVLKALKYSLIEIAEAMANTLQHILTRGMGMPAAGYMDTLVKAREREIISEELFSTFKPFFEFRNLLIHRYWKINDTLILKNLREGYRDFFVFIDEIEKLIKK